MTKWTKNISLLSVLLQDFSLLRMLILISDSRLLSAKNFYIRSKRCPNVLSHFQDEIGFFGKIFYYVA
jgi:hypothetical protein